MLLGRGHEYGDTDARIEPFDAIKEVNDEARQAAVVLITEGSPTPERKSYLYVNNRLEVCAPLTIEAVVG